MSPLVDRIRGVLTREPQKGEYLRHRVQAEREDVFRALAWMEARGLAELRSLGADRHGWVIGAGGSMSKPRHRSATPSPALRGIRTIDDLRLRCRIDTETGCWLWSMAVQLYERQREPETRVWLADMRMCLNGKKAAALLDGKKFAKGQLAYGTCGCWRCVNPAHVKVGTPAQRGAFISARGALKGNPARMAQTQKLGRSRSHLTPELVTWARESPQTGAEICHALDAAPSVVSRIRRGESWREDAIASNASVFTWRPAA